MPRAQTQRAQDSKPRILLTFVGSHDPFRGEGRVSGDGPVLSLLAAEKFSEVRLFYNSVEFLKRASDVLRALRDRGDETPVRYEEIPVVDPTDHAALYQHIEDRALKIAKEVGAKADIWIAISSGTPQMQTCWMLLVLGGVIKARLVQILPPHKLKSGECVWREIDLSGARFPKIIPPGQLQRRLALAERELGELRVERKQQASEEAAGLIGSAPVFRDAVRLAKQFAGFDTPILLLGETGTGKEEFASLIHFHSVRAEKPFLPINCASLPENLAESELFGHMKGAFTGAGHDKPGIFEVGSSGTVFLDEIGELSLNVQAKLLRVLESGLFRRVGATEENKTSARIIAATNRDLQTMIADGRFREDLYFRINRAEIHLPALRERREDISALAKHFLEQFCKRQGRELSFEPDVLQALEKEEWPGNIRELKNVVERLAMQFSTKRTLRLADLVLPARRRPAKRVSPIISIPDEPIDFPNLLRNWERDMMEQAISRFQGNRSAAARHLGYEEATFRKKCREYLGRKT